jgi:hypothetical protein
MIACLHRGRAYRWLAGENATMPGFCFPSMHGREDMGCTAAAFIIAHPRTVLHVCISSAPEAGERERNKTEMPVNRREHPKDDVGGKSTSTTTTRNAYWDSSIDRRRPPQRRLPFINAVARQSSRLGLVLRCLPPVAD